MSDLTSARAYLHSSVDPSSGAPSLHAHLSALLQSLIRDRDPQPLRRFEELSVQLKQQRSKEKGEKQGTAGGVVGVDTPASSLGSGSGAGKASALAHLQRCVDLIKPPKKINEDGEEEEEEEGEANPAAPDLQEEAFLWQQTGRRTQPTARCPQLPAAAAAAAANQLLTHLLAVCQCPCGLCLLLRLAACRRGPDRV
jgi:hypothetical protein